MSTEMTTQPQRQTIISSNRGLVLTSLDDMYRFAKYACEAGLAPKDMNKPEACVIALQLGAEVGLSPMAALQSICVINGRPSLWGDGMLAVCQASDVFDHEAFSETSENRATSKGGNPEDGYTAICTVRRLPKGKIVTKEFSVKDAKRAGLWANDKKPIWKLYPQRMLQMRARAMALRDTFSDVLRGMQMAEEAQDMDPITVRAVVTDSPQKGLPHISRSEQMAAEMAGSTFAPKVTQQAPSKPVETVKPAILDLPLETPQQEPVQQQDPEPPQQQSVEPQKQEVHAPTNIQVPEGLLTELFDASTIGACSDAETKWVSDSMDPEVAAECERLVAKRKDEIRREKQKKSGTLV